MTDMVPAPQVAASKQQITIAEIQDQLAARQELAATRVPTSTRKGRVEEARREFEVDPTGILTKIRNLARSLSGLVDTEIKPGPLTQAQINRVSREFVEFERLRVAIEGLEPRYRALIFAHLDATGPRIPGRPVTHTPGRVAAEGPGPHYIFERRGGNYENPTLDEEGMKTVLPPEVVAQVFETVHVPAVEAHDEERFNLAAFTDLVDSGKIDLDVVAPFLTLGKRRTPTFNKTLVDGDK